MTSTLTVSYIWSFNGRRIELRAYLYPCTILDLASHAETVAQKFAALASPQPVPAAELRVRGFRDGRVLVTHSLASTPDHHFRAKALAEGWKESR